MGINQIATLIMAVAAVSLAGWGPRAQAWDAPVPGSRYLNARALGMGGVYIEQADDAASSLFYNPAGIGKIRGFQFEPINVQLQADQGLLGSLGASSLKFPTFADYRSTVANDPGVYHGASLSLAPALSFRGFALGVLYHQSAAARAEDDGTFTVRGHRELVPAAGFALRLAGGVFRIGYSGQYVSKTEGEETGVPADSAREWHDGFAQGAGISHNLGLALTLPWNFSPSFNFVARNIGGLAFSRDPIMSLANDSIGAPADVPATYDLAYGMHFKLGSGGGVHVAAEYRDLIGASGESILSRTALGIEVDLGSKFQIRGGVGAARLSYGVGYRGRKSDLQLVWYGEDWGPGLLTNGDPRWALQWRARLF